MLRQLITAPPSASLREADGLFRAARLRHLVVVEDGIVVGLVSHREFLEAYCAALRNGGRDTGAFLEDTTLEQLMHAQPATSPPEGSLVAAASQMLALRIGCLPVAIASPRGPRLVGLLTEAGLLRAAYLPATPGG
jgi:acetoin utilization protein AcuB